jgi:protein-tyrosine phosphatase
MRHLVREAGLDGRIVIDSAGTAAYHTGEPPDRRSAAAGRRRGVSIEGRARQFVRADFERFNYVLAMDAANYGDLTALASNAGRLFLLRDFDPQSPKGSSVPDPYYGGDQGFEEVLDQCFAACAGLLRHIRETHGL